MTKRVDLPPVIHTWRDGTYHFNGCWGASEHKPPTAHLADEFGTEKVVEIRHLKGSKKEGFGHVFYWEKDQSEGWVWSLLGEAREEHLTILLSA